MICNVQLVAQKLGKRQFMVTLQKEDFRDRVFEPAALADAIEGWGTIYSTERVKIGQSKDFARLYVTTTDLSMNARYLYKQVLAEQKVLEAKEALKRREEASHV